MEINRHAVIGLLDALLRDVLKIRDCSNHVESLTHHLAGAIETAIRQVKCRGEYEYVLVYFPEVGKLVDKGLSSRTFDWKGFYSLDPKPCRNLKFALADLFYEANGSNDRLSIGYGQTQGGLRDGVTEEEVYLLRQVLYLLKKVEIPCPEQAVKDTVYDFIAMDQGLREPSGSWNSDIWIPGNSRFCGDSALADSHPRAGKLWKTVDDVFASIVPMYEVDRLRIHPKHGPGAVADMKTGGDKMSFPHWPSKLEGQFPLMYFTQHRMDLHVTEDVTISPSLSEPPARLIAVPKTYKGPRLIASEPIAHQFLQQGLMQWMRDNLSPLLRNSINFTSQEESRTAALQASRKGDLATVDLSSASDRLSCWAVERALGSNTSLLACLHAVRTRCIIDATGTDANLSMQMRKFAAQGSAVTFPVQTIIYAGLAIAAVLFDENLKPSRRNISRVARKVRVFGDDIICPRNCVPTLTLMLNSLELKVNASKTHISGAFRESCGMDAFRGHDVTPAYHKLLEWDKSPEKAASWIEVSNNFHRKGLWETAAYMMDQVPEKFRRKTLTTGHPGDGYRFFTFCKGYLTQAQVRFSQNLHRDEARVFSPRARVRKKSRESWHDLHQYFLESPQPQSKWTAGYVTKKTFQTREVWVPLPPQGE